MWSEPVIAVTLFTLTVTVLTVFVMVVKRGLMPRDLVEVTVNNSPLMLTNGSNLLQSLLNQSVLVPAACGGRGLCGQCKVTINAPSVPPLPVERGHLSVSEARAGVRLACAHRVRPQLRLQVADAYLQVSTLTCRVIGARCVSALLRELQLELPEPHALPFKPGQYVMIDVPAYSLRFDAFDIDPAFRTLWQAEGLFKLTSASPAPARRAYSLSNAPGDGTSIELLVRLALPPSSAPPNVPPGIVSSYLFGLAVGDTLAVAGPYGNFHITDSDRDKVFVAGGAGMAPMRAILRQELAHPTSDCRLIFCYGARSLRDLCYKDEFDALAAAHARFDWHVALSEPVANTDWDGPTGFIHTLLRDKVLAQHALPEALEYYICGPPLMSAATINLLHAYDIDDSSIFHDSFGD